MTTTANPSISTGELTIPSPQRRRYAEAQPEEWVAESGEAQKVLAVHRVGALAFAAVLLTFGVLGFAGGLAYFSTEGEEILGLSSNGLLSTISILTAALLAVSALRGPRTASAVMMGVGILFLLSGLLNMAVLETERNVLAFAFENVVFSLLSGFFLLLLGAYGRVSGNLPAESPYRRQLAYEEEADEYPQTEAEWAAEREMREAEIAVVCKRATPEQWRRVDEMRRERSRAGRRAVWMELEAAAR